MTGTISTLNDIIQMEISAQKAQWNNVLGKSRLRFNYMLFIHIVRPLEQINCVSARARVRAFTLHSGSTFNRSLRDNVMDPAIRVEWNVHGNQLSGAMLIFSTSAAHFWIANRKCNTTQPNANLARSISKAKYVYTNRLFQFNINVCWHRNN